MSNNTFILEEELKRIGFIMSYDSSRMVYENKEKKENLLIENKIEKLFNSPTVNEVVFEKALKSIFKEQWGLKKERILSEQWARGTDQVGYWKVLFDQLKTAGIGVKWEVANDPVKSTFMYWGSWVIWKDVNKNGGWPISFSGADKKLWLFKFQGGKYAGQPASNIIIESKYINSNFNLGQWGKITGATGGPSLNNLIKTKPKSASTAQACKTVDGKPIAPNQIPTVASQIFKDLSYAFDGVGTYEGEAVAAYGKITCKPILDAVNAKVREKGMSGINNVGDWAKDEMSDYDYNQFRAIWTGLQKLGYKAPPVNQAMRAAGVVGDVTGVNAIEKVGEGAKKAFDRLMNMTIDDIMEGFREIVSGIGGTVATLILTVIPGGQAVNMLIYGVLTAWDFVQASKGDTNIFNIILDSFSLILSGIGLQSSLKPLQGAKSVLGAEKTAVGFFSKMAQKFPKMSQFFKSISGKITGGAKWVIDGIKKGVTWLMSKFSFLSKFGNMLLGSLNKVITFIEGIGNAIGSSVGGVVAKYSPNLLKKGTTYLTQIAKSKISPIMQGIENKLGKEVYEELDKKIVGYIKNQTFEAGQEYTVETFRPVICKVGQSYCNTFDIMMNGAVATHSLGNVRKSGEETLDFAKKSKGAVGNIEKFEKKALVAKSGTETLHKGVESVGSEENHKG